MSNPEGHEHLRKIVGMLGSDHDGERASAARFATILLRRLGMTWGELVDRAFRAQVPPQQTFQQNWQRYARNAAYQPPPPRQPDRSATWGLSGGGTIDLWDLLHELEERHDELDNWDRQYVNALLAQGPKVKATRNQWQMLIRIAEKICMPVQ